MPSVLAAPQVDIESLKDMGKLQCAGARGGGRGGGNLPQRKPMPVGPHILWLDATIQSAPSAWTSTGMLGTLWQQSSSTRAPACAPHPRTTSGARLLRCHHAYFFAPGMRTDVVR